MAPARFSARRRFRGSSNGFGFAVLVISSPGKIRFGLVPAGDTFGAPDQSHRDRHASAVGQRNRGCFGERCESVSKTVRTDCLSLAEFTRGVSPTDHSLAPTPFPDGDIWKSGAGIDRPSDPKPLFPRAGESALCRFSCPFFLSSD